MLKVQVAYLCNYLGLLSGIICVVGHRPRAIALKAGS